MGDWKPEEYAFILSTIESCPHSTSDSLIHGPPGSPSLKQKLEIAEKLEQKVLNINDFDIFKNYKFFY